MKNQYVVTSRVPTITPCHMTRRQVELHTLTTQPILYIQRGSVVALNLKPFTSHIENIEVGATIRINHTVCEAGEDTRRRLYLTRTLADPTVVVGYCHNCGQGGKVSGQIGTLFRDKRHKGITSISTYHMPVEVVAPPKNTVLMLKDWPTYAQAWAMKNKLTQTDLKVFNIAFDVTSDRVYIPYLDGGRVLDGYQLRLVRGTGPKYLTVCSEDSKGFGLYHSKDTSYSNLVIVEDLVSMIHIRNATDKASVIVNCGVKINPFVVNKAKDYKNVVIWFDNDGEHIVKQAKQYAKTIKMYSAFPNVEVIEELSDPKHYGRAEIYKSLELLWTQ